MRGLGGGGFPFISTLGSHPSQPGLLDPASSEASLAQNASCQRFLSWQPSSIRAIATHFAGDIPSTNSVIAQFLQSRRPKGPEPITPGMWSEMETRIVKMEHSLSRMSDVIQALVESNANVRVDRIADLIEAETGVSLHPVYPHGSRSASSSSSSIANGSGLSAADFRSMIVSPAQSQNSSNNPSGRNTPNTPSTPSPVQISYRNYTSHAAALPRPVAKVAAVAHRLHPPARAGASRHSSPHLHDYSAARRAARPSSVRPGSETPTTPKKAPPPLTSPNSASPTKALSARPTPPKDIHFPHRAYNTTHHPQTKYELVTQSTA